MAEPKPLDTLFKEKVFRIPDLQRGYAWQVKDNLKDFCNESGDTIPVRPPGGRMHRGFITPRLALQSNG